MSEKYRHLREAAEAVERATPRREAYNDPLDEFADHVGLMPKPKTNAYFAKHQDEIDAKAHPDPNVGFVHQPNGQMYMTDGTSLTHNVGKGTVAVDHGDGHVSHHPAGEETEPYLTRPKAEGKQLALPLGKSDAVRPADPALHALRMTNPHLNDYRFDVHVNPRGYHSVAVTHTPSNATAASFTWKSGTTGREKMHQDGVDRTGEVEMIEVKDQHRGRGLATAMWDYAHLHAGRDGSQLDHPVHSDNRSIEGNHWAHFVGGASMARTKGFGVQHY